MNIEIYDLGRGKSTVQIKKVSEDLSSDEVAAIIAHEASPHLLSSEVGAIWDSKTKTGTIIVGGFRPVGKAKAV